MTVTNDGLPKNTNIVYIFNVTHNTIVSYYYVHVQYIPVPHVYYLISALLIFSFK